MHGKFPCPLPKMVQLLIMINLQYDLNSTLQYCQMSLYQSGKVDQSQAPYRRHNKDQSKVTELISAPWAMLGQKPNYPVE